MKLFEGNTKYEQIGLFLLGCLIRSRVFFNLTLYIHFRQK